MGYAYFPHSELILAPMYPTTGLRALPLVMKATSRTASRSWLIGYLVVSVADLIAEGLHATVPAFIGVVLAMPALIGYLWTTRTRSDRLTRLVTIALIFSWLGDWVGDLIAPHVVTKLVLFFVGHIFFVVAFWPYRRNSVLTRPLALLPYVVIIGALLIWISMSAGIIAPAVIGYGILLGLMAVTATGLNWTAGIGSIIFVVSDLSIAVTVFVIPGQLEQAGLLIMSTYLVAQLLIVWGVLRRQAADQEAEHPQLMATAAVQVDRRAAQIGEA